MSCSRRYFWPGEVVMGWVEDTEKRGGNAEYVRRTDDDDENDEEQDEEDVDEFEYEYEDDASLTTASPEEPGALRNAEQEGAEAPFAALLASLRAPSCRARKGTAMHNKPLPLAAFTEIHSRSAQWLLQQHADAKQAYVNRGGEEGEQLAAIARLPALFSCVDPAVLKTEILAFKTEKDRALLMGEIIETLSRQQMAQAHEAGQPSEVGQQPRFSNTATSQILLGLARQRTADKLAVLHAKPAGTGAAKAPATGAPKAAGLPGPKPKPMPQQQQQQQAHVQRPGQGVAAGMPHIARRPLPQMPRPQQQPQQAPPIKREAPAPPAGKALVPIGLPT